LWGKKKGKFNGMLPSKGYNLALGVNICIEYRMELRKDHAHVILGIIYPEQLFGLNLRK